MAVAGKQVNQEETRLYSSEKYARFLEKPTEEELNIAEKIVFSRQADCFKTTNREPHAMMTALGLATANDLSLPLGPTLDSESSLASFHIPQRLVEFGRQLALDSRVIEALQEQQQFKTFYETHVPKQVELENKDPNIHCGSQKNKNRTVSEDLWCHLESLEEETYLEQASWTFTQSSSSSNGGNTFWDTSSFIEIGRSLLHGGQNLPKKKDSAWERLLNDNRCAICQGLIVGASVLNCPSGHVFCGACVAKWLVSNSTCPLCAAPATKAQPVWNMEQIIERSVHDLGDSPEKEEWLERKADWQRRTNKYASTRREKKRFFGMSFCSNSVAMLAERVDNGDNEEDEHLPNDSTFNHIALALASLLFAAVILVRCNKL